MFTRILIANRGEIAARIAKTAHKLGMSSVGIYAEIDQDTWAMQLVREARSLGHGTLDETYLNIPKIIQIAKEANCDAIHPGYGFLSGSADFAAACEQAQIAFIGPSAAVLMRVNAKQSLSQTLLSSGIPVGLPNSPVRHIQVQIAADHSGACLHLFERDCAIRQDNHTLVTEAPCLSIDDKLREKLWAMATEVAKTVQYCNIGSVSFLVDAAGNPYFLDMYPYLQVEHAVTECVADFDLIAWQFAIAAKQKIPLSQDQIKRKGHAIAVHVYAENTTQSPSAPRGLLQKVVIPERTNMVRVDSALHEGDSFALYPHTLLAKVIAWGDDRQQAIFKLRQSLDHVHILGIHNNLNLLRKITESSEFLRGVIDTDFLKRNTGLLENPATGPLPLVWEIAAVGSLLDNIKHQQNGYSYHTEPGLPWKKTDRWRINEGITHEIRLRNTQNGQIENLHIQHSGNEFSVVKEAMANSPEASVRFDAGFIAPHVIQVIMDERAQFFYCMQYDNTLYIFMHHTGFIFEVLDPFST